MRYKLCPAMKAAGGNAATSNGVFEGLVSVFGNIDAYGDVVMPGAFKATIEDWANSGDPIPVMWSHRMDDPRFSIGQVEEIAELEPHDARLPDWVDPWAKEHGGLWVRAALDMGDDATEMAVHTMRLLAKRRVKKFSFAYDVIDGGWGVVNGEDAYELRALKLYEVSVTPIGANDLTELLGGKTGALIAGIRELAAQPGKLRRIVSDQEKDELASAVTALGKALDIDERAATDDVAKDEEPGQVKSEEPRRSVESIRQLIDIHRQLVDVVS